MTQEQCKLGGEGQGVQGGLTRKHHISELENNRSDFRNVEMRKHLCKQLAAKPRAKWKFNFQEVL